MNNRISTEINLHIFNFSYLDSHYCSYFYKGPPVEGHARSEGHQHHGNIAHRFRF